jgi:hypothetical protein
MHDLDHNADNLQKLLRCKRYERPPPGYFISFSDRVIARIETEEAVVYSSWWAWLVDRFDAKPVLVCAYGLAVSSLLFMGFRISQMFEAEVAAAPTFNGPWLAVTPASPILFPQDVTEVAYTLPTLPTGFRGPRSPFREQSGHLLFQQSNFRLEPAGFGFSGQ